jgi:hypothetical protein
MSPFDHFDSSRNSYKASRLESMEEDQEKDVYGIINREKL